jgi:hypothetical protein
MLEKPGACDCAGNERDGMWVLVPGCKFKYLCYSEGHEDKNGRYYSKIWTKIWKGLERVSRELDFNTS